MTPAARVQSAIEVLDRILAGEPAERTLTAWARRSRFAGSSDRAAVRDHVYDALRQRNRCAVAGGALTGRGLMIGLIRLSGREPGTIFDGGRYGPAPLAPGEGGVDPDPDLVDLPDWIVQPLRRSLGRGFADYAGLLGTRAPVTLRVNLRKATVDGVIGELAADGVVCARNPLSPTALSVGQGARRVASTPAYREGRVEFQDGSSQAAMDLVPLSAGMRVLDFCAGGGGKTLALAARVEAEFHAHDGDPDRMRDLPARAARAGVRVSTLAPGEPAEAGYDLVLCDVPCSGSGTWRRDPDARWRITPAELESLTGLQRTIADTAATLVKPGGTLAYATCSVLGAENDEVIDNFLSQHSGWDCDRRARWPMSPAGDGFFVTLLTRR